MAESSRTIPRSDLGMFVRVFSEINSAMEDMKAKFIERGLLEYRDGELFYTEKAMTMLDEKYRQIFGKDQIKGG